MLLAVVGGATDVPDVQPATMLESVLTVGGFVVFILLVIAVQLWAYRRRRRGDEATRYDGRGAEVMLGNWFT